MRIFTLATYLKDRYGGVRYAIVHDTRARRDKWSVGIIRGYVKRVGPRFGSRADAHYFLNILEGNHEAPETDQAADEPE